jgi:hypothetical protein
LSFSTSNDHISSCTDITATVAVVFMQAASARLVQLSAADASMSQRLAEFRRRSAAQRAAAARQLADLRAASSSGGGAGDAAAAAATARAAGSSGRDAAGVQVQCRFSIPSEFDGFGGSETEPAGELLAWNV